MPTQTGPLTGGTLRTGVTGRFPQQRQPLMARATAWWQAMTKRQKMMAAGIVLALLLVVGLSFKIQKATAYVNLYENSLSTEDVNDVTTALAENHIPYIKSLDNHVTVPPGKRVEALADLMNAGIPRHPFYESPAGSNTQTHEAWTADQHRILEREITMVLRQFNEIADANVKLVIPSENDAFFRDEKDSAKAAIVVRLKPGTDTLPQEKVKAIVNFVASSVPSLKPENVQLTDTNGKLFSAMLKDSESTLSSDKMIDEKRRFQKLFEAQIRQILDKALGPDKYALAVNVDLDWNKSQSIVQTNGTDLNASGVVPSQVQKDIEEYTKTNPQSTGVKQLAYSNGDMVMTARGGNYKREHILQKNAINSTETRTDVTPGQIKQITASVLTEEMLSDDNQRALRAAVRNAIGFNYDRGDAVSFGMLPFHRDELETLRQSIQHPGIFRHEFFSPMAGAIALRMTMAALVIGIVVVGVVLYRQQQAKLEKTELVLAAGPTASLSDISDFMSEKTGRATAAAAAARETQKLEALVKEKPTKVAELLKTTWLAEK